MSDEKVRIRYCIHDMDKLACDICKPAISFAAPTGLAANVVVNQALVNEIVQRAKDSQWGLDTADMQPEIEKWSSADLDTLAHCLVSSWSAKYDLVSVFSAAMSVIQEKAANDQAMRPET